MRDKTKVKHCDEYIHDSTAPRCLRFYLLVHRMPAMDSALMAEFGVNPKLFATTSEGVRVRVNMASRFGDLGITDKLTQERGYETRVAVSDLTNFSQEP